MAWLIVVVAGLLEVAWSVGLRFTHGFTRLVPSVLTGAAIVASMWLLGVATKTLPVSTAYGVWVGIGAVGSVAVGALFFDEPVSGLRGLFVALLLCSIVGLKLTSAPA